MKKQHLNRIATKQLFQILGGITDPLEDPDEDYVTPIDKDPFPTDKPDDPTKDERVPSRN